MKEKKIGDKKKEKKIERRDYRPKKKEALKVTERENKGIADIPKKKKNEFKNDGPPSCYLSSSDSAKSCASFFW